MSSILSGRHSKISPGWHSSTSQNLPKASNVIEAALPCSIAHSSATCLPVANRDFPILPLYNNFNISLSRKDLAQLKLLWKEYGSINYPISPGLVTPELLKAGMFQKNVYLTPPAYEFTNLGKIPVGTLEFSLFNEVQEPLLLRKLLKLELAAKHALYKNAPDKSY